MIKAKIRGEEGFILSIVAFGIFVLMASFAISVQQTVINATNRIKTINNNVKAEDISDTTTRYLMHELNKHSAGYNLIIPTCAYGEYAEGQLNDPRCDEITNILANAIGNKNVRLTMQIKGRGTSEDEFTTGTCPGLIGSGCYTIPLPGTGDAGDRCSMYTPTNDADAIVDDNGQIPNPPPPDGAKQIDYSCNWNKLAFGSSSMDRVAIPLYYDTGTEIVNPFNDSTDPSLKATEFSIRMRPPCLPCGSANRTCVAGEDETICDDNERYELDESDGNDIVVQWQLSGECGGEECGLIQYVVWDGGEVDEAKSSVISEERINGMFPSYIALNSIFQSEGVDTSTYNNLLILDRLLETQKPVLTLFLTEKLIDTEGNNVPYLEYQIITDKPIGSPKIKAEAIVNVNGYGSRKTLYKEEKTPLVDFAIQN